MPTRATHGQCRIATFRHIIPEPKANCWAAKSSTRRRSAHSDHDVKKWTTDAEVGGEKQIETAGHV
jgi:hypothetical protein